jgi:hypothetical protein
MMLNSAVAMAMLLGTWVPFSESSSCQSDIVSSTAVATFCGHREDDHHVLDFYILWRGKPGWFQNGPLGGGGGGGSRRFGAGTRGIVSEHKTYGTVTIAYQANFDTSVATIGQTTFALDRVNAVVMDYVEEEWRTFATRRIEPRLPLGRDWNLAIAQQSSDMRRDLQCAVPMPAPPARSQMLVMTVCDKLKSQ